MSVVAEGIENQAQLTTLTDMGCTHAQGTLFASAMPASKIPEYFLSAGKTSPQAA